MAVLIVIFVVAIVFFMLYVFSTKCRAGHPGLTGLRKYAYAHRGLHGGGVPENSMAAFRKAKDAGYGIELDIHLMADGNLAVIHDASLRRTAGKEIFIEDLTTEQLQEYRLENTEETIPEFRQVLELYAGAAPLIVELKSERNNYAALCKAACDMLDSYDGAYCVESFDPRCIRWLRKNRPDVIRGMLTENYFATPGSKVPWHLKVVLKSQMLNFLLRPDFVAYRFRDHKAFSNLLCRKLWKVQGVAWTLRNMQEYNEAVKDGWIPIFENILP